MGAIDLPPGVGLLGDRKHAFLSPTAPRRLASIGLSVIGLAWAVTWACIAKQPYRAHAASLTVLPMALVGVGLVGFAVRKSRLSVDGGGLSWGLGSFTFRLDMSRLRAVDVYDDGVALVHLRGSPWFLGRRDWDRFDALVRALGRTGAPMNTHARRAPWRARMQAYGRALDAIIATAMVAAIGVAFVAFAG